MSSSGRLLPQGRPGVNIHGDLSTLWRRTLVQVLPKRLELGRLRTDTYLGCAGDHQTFRLRPAVRYLFISQDRQGLAKAAVQTGQNKRSARRPNLSHQASHLRLPTAAIEAVRQQCQHRIDIPWPVPIPPFGLTAKENDKDLLSFCSRHRGLLKRNVLTVRTDTRPSKCHGFLIAKNSATRNRLKTLDCDKCCNTKRFCNELN